MMINSAELTFISRSVNERFARMSVAAFATQLDPTVEELAEIKTAVSEAVTNCIVHAYGSDLGTIKMKMQLFDSNVLRIDKLPEISGVPGPCTSRLPERRI